MENTKTHAVQHCEGSGAARHQQLASRFEVRVRGHHVLAELDFTPCGPTTTVSQNVSNCLNVSETLSKPNTIDGVQLRIAPGAVLRTIAQKPPI